MRERFLARFISKLKSKINSPEIYIYERAGKFFSFFFFSILHSFHLELCSTDVFSPRCSTTEQSLMLNKWEVVCHSPWNLENFCRFSRPLAARRQASPLPPSADPVPVPSACPFSFLNDHRNFLRVDERASGNINFPPHSLLVLYFLY